MGKNQDPGSGKNIPDPQHCFQAAAAAAGGRQPGTGFGLGGGGSNSWLNSLEQLSSMSSMLGSHQQQLQRPASRDSRGESREERNTSGEDNDTKVRFLL